jgi:hypothetical protein
MKTARLILLYVSVAIGIIQLPSCAPAYVPNAFNIPLVKNEHQVSLAAFGGTNGFDAQVSGAVYKHLALMGNYSHANNPQTGKDSSGFRKHNFTEGGIGYSFLKEEKPICLEVYTGYGMGNSASRAASSGLYVNKGDVVSGDYSRYFLQADFGFTSSIIEVGAAVRGSYVDFVNYSVDAGGSSKSYHNLADWYIEPVGFVRVGYKFIKAQFQIGASLRSDFLSVPTPKFTSEPFYISGGLYFTLFRKWEKG